MDCEVVHSLVLAVQLGDLLKSPKFNLQVTLQTSLELLGRFGTCVPHFGAGGISSQIPHLSMGRGDILFPEGLIPLPGVSRPPIFWF